MQCGHGDPTAVTVWPKGHPQVVEVIPHFDVVGVGVTGGVVIVVTTGRH